MLFCYNKYQRYNFVIYYNIEGIEAKFNRKPNK